MVIPWIQKLKKKINISKRQQTTSFFTNFVNDWQMFRVKNKEVWYKTAKTPRNKPICPK